MFILSRDYFGNICELDEIFIRKTQYYLDGLRQAKVHFIREYLSKHDEQLYDIARCCEYEISGIKGYLETVFGIELYTDENGKYKIKSKEQEK